MDKKSEEYLRQYIKLTDTIKQKIEAHAARYHIKAEICAWYSDWEDFCSDWCDICGYSRTEARKLYHGGIGEFMKLPEGRETSECVGFFVGQVSQLWVIKDLIEKRLNDMGETGVEVRVSK